MVDDDAHAGDAYKLFLEHVFHFAGGCIAVEADDIVFDQYRDVFGSLEFAIGSQFVDARVDGV